MKYMDSYYGGYTHAYPLMWEQYITTPTTYQAAGMGAIAPDDVFAPWSPFSPGGIEEMAAEPAPPEVSAIPETQTVGGTLIKEDAEKSEPFDWMGLSKTIMETGTSVFGSIMQAQAAAKAIEDKAEREAMERELRIKEMELIMAGKVAAKKMPYEMPAWAIPAALGFLGVVVVLRVLR